MAGKMRKGLSVVMALVFVISALLFVGRLYDDQRAAESSRAAQELVVPSPNPAPDIPDEPIPLDPAPVVEPVPEIEPIPFEEPIPTEAPREWEPLSEDSLFLMDLDLDALRQTSGNVLGWIYIPDSVIDYPLMAFADNETGLHQAWDGTKSSAGSIFIECKNRRDFSDFNTLIYGHHMRKGTMFGSLKQYAEQEYLDAHRLIYIVTDDYVRRYEVFSAYEAGVTSDTYRLYFADKEMKQSVLDYYVASAGHESELVPTVEDRILTLSTCMGTGTYDTRWVVQAVLTGEFSR